MAVKQLTDTRKVFLCKINCNVKKYRKLCHMNVFHVQINNHHLAENITFLVLLL